MTSAGAIVVCGLPASGKTTTAGRLHRVLGGVLIRSCDVYQSLGISLPDWVERTHGFTLNVPAYDAVRDAAYREMARRLDRALARRALVVLDAVHGERDKREAVYRICLAHGVRPILLLCRCDDAEEVSRRFRIRRGREAEPEHEASDLSVFRDIARRWQDPAGDRLPDGAVPEVVVHDTLAGRVTTWSEVVSPLLEPIRSALTPWPRR